MTGFKELNLSGAALHRIETLGFKQPTPIQQEAIPALIEGRNVVGQAQTGSGERGDCHDAGYSIGYRRADQNRAASGKTPSICR